MTRALLSVHSVIWGIPMVLLTLGVGIRIMTATGFAPQRLLIPALRSFIQTFTNRTCNDGVSSFRALCTALGATVGTGNIIGVAGAISLGGPGAVFWMWICGFFAMGTKFAEAVLAVRYRNRRGRELTGGPMYMITDGMGSRWYPLAVCYCVLGVAASFGVGNAAQINAVISGINRVIRQCGGQESLRQNVAMGLILAVFVGSVLLGGAGRIGAAAEYLIPVVSVFYIGLCAAVLVLRREYIGQAFCTIVQGAFSPGAVTGGAVGSGFQVLQTGCARGVFTNEAGMGTASMAHGGADVSHPVEQGLMGIVEVFLDTIVLCTLTALVILVSGSAIPYGMDAGGTLTFDAFTRVCGGWAASALTAALCCFAFATVLGWGLYGVRCAQFLWGDSAWEPFVLCQTAAVVLGAALRTDTIWLLSELFNGLMAIPNLIVLAALTPELCRLTKEYIKK